MSSKSSRPNTWTVVSLDENTRLSYAPQVSPSPFTVGSGKGSLEIVITNPTDLSIKVNSIEFKIKVAGDPKHPPYPDSTALTTTTADIGAVVSDPSWTVEKLDKNITHGHARYKLKPQGGSQSLEIPPGKSLAVQIYDFPINIVSGTSMVQIIEDTDKGTALPYITVTTFPWGFAFRDLAANVPDGSGWKPVAQVENGKCVTLFWHSSVAELGSYTIYYSNSLGQQKCTPTKPGEWKSQPLHEDTVFTLGVITTSSVGDELKASMSIAVAVRNPELTVTNLDVLTTTTLKGDLTVGSDASRPKLTVYTSPLVIDAADNVVLTGNNLSFGAGTYKIVVDKTNGLSATGPLTVTGPLSVTDGLKMGSANGVIQRGDVKITTGDLGLYSNNPTNWIRLVTNNSPIKFFTDGGDGTNPALTINPDGTLEAQGHNGINVHAPTGPAALLRFSCGSYTGISNFDNNAEISNDLGASFGKALMLSGNSSRQPGGDRWVQVWDHLEVAKNLYVYGTPYFKPYGETGWCTLAMYDISRNGVYWQGMTGPASISDLRFKSEVQPVSSALEKIRRLSGITFRWNEDAMQYFTRDIETIFSAGPNATDQQSQKVWQTERANRRNQLATTQVGVGAQDVEAVLPEAVTTDPEGYKSVRYENLIPLLIEAIKEQDQLADRQQREIERLKLALGMNESEVSK